MALNTIGKLHDQAMNLADRGDAYLKGGKKEQAVKAYSLACGLEDLSALLHYATCQPGKNQADVWILILHRSATWLAVNAEQPARALRIAARGILYAANLPYNGERAKLIEAQTAAQRMFDEQSGHTNKR